MPIRYLSFLILVLLAQPFSGCKPDSSAPRTAAAGALKTYAARGVVQAVSPDQSSATIKHEAIAGYMGAMTMDFPARDTNTLHGILPGDEIAFTLAVTETNDWIENVRVLGKTNVSIVSGPPGWHIADPELSIGDALPDYEFTSENNLPVRFSDFRGRALAFTFFFTSCSLPDYCPRMSRNFSEVQKILLAASNAPANWQLLSISFDSSFDTPEILSGYARYYRGDNTNRWLFAVASPQTLVSLAPKVDLNYWHEGGSISHNLRTVVLDTNGKISAQFDGNEWTPQQLADAVQKAARVAITPP